MQQRFIDPQHGVLMEKPLGAVDNWFEPGHQFEWYFLLESSDLLRGSTTACFIWIALLPSPNKWALISSTGAVRAMLDLEPDGGLGTRLNGSGPRPNTCAP